MKKIVPIAAGAILALTASQLYLLGAKGGIGPLRFIRKRKIASHPGNGEAYGFDSIKQLENSPLAGKRICVLGSSVAYGAASQGWAVPEYLARRFGCAVTKEAVSGATLVDTGPSSYVSRLKTLDRAEKVDLFICQLSTNDARKGLPLGEIGDGSTKTVTGAMEYIIRYVRETWSCPVMFFTGSRYDSAAYAAMVARLMELRDPYGLGVIDLWSSDSFNDIPATDRKLFMADPVHPTKAGYRDWWGPEMTRQILQFLEIRIRAVWPSAGRVE